MMQQHVTTTGGINNENNNNNIIISSANNTPPALPMLQSIEATDIPQSPSRTKIIIRDLIKSTYILLDSKLLWLLIFGPIALIGDATGSLGEAICFACSGIALIPCAERLSFVTEQVAAHTNGTIGALLNATFGNAPELLISTAALRAGFYRVVQLAMLGSMLTNLLFVFGVASLIGGFRWQVQELRITSGNVSVGMLLASTTGSLLPAALYYSGQLQKDDAATDTSSGSSNTAETSGSSSSSSSLTGGVPPNGILEFSRVNAAVMMILYLCYLIFQLGTHKDEFDEDENVVESANGHMVMLAPSFVTAHPNTKRHPAKRNQFCLNFWTSLRSTAAGADGGGLYQAIRRTSTLGINNSSSGNLRLNSPCDQSSLSSASEHDGNNHNDDGDDDTDPETTAIKSLIHHHHHHHEKSINISPIPSRLRGDSHSLPSRTDAEYYSQYHNGPKHRYNGGVGGASNNVGGLTRRVNNGFTSFGPSDEGDEVDAFDEENNRKGLKRKSSESDMDFDSSSEDDDDKQMSLWTGILWLLIITLGISAMSDILVDTIDGFAYRLQISEVFTSMVIVPFFSNIAEQVSAVIFAYHNKMDLMVGVTVGSAIQIAMFVLPGCVLIGLAVDRSMTLFFRGFETCCLFLGVICVAAVLQGGTTNWLVGMTLIGIYIMIATGIWFHELEDLSHDAELAIQNRTAF